MENDQRLTPLPKTADLHAGQHEYSNYSNFYDDEAFESKRSIQQYFNVIYKRLPIILALTVLITAAAAFYMYRLPSQYEATTAMIIEPRKPKIQAKDSININFGDDINYYNTQLKLLQNPDLMKEVVIRLGLYRDPNLFNGEDRGFLGGLRSLVSGTQKAGEKENSLPVISDTDAASGTRAPLTPEETARTEAYASILLAGLKVEQVERTNIVNVTLQGNNPELIAKVSHKVAEVFIDEDAKRETKGASDALNDLKKSIEDLKSTISSDEADLIAEMERYKLPLQDKGQDLAASRLQGLSETWMKALENRRQIEARYSTALQASSRGEAMNIPDISESKMVQDAVRLNTEREANSRTRSVILKTRYRRRKLKKLSFLSNTPRNTPM